MISITFPKEGSEKWVRYDLTLIVPCNALVGYLSDNI